MNIIKIKNSSKTMQHVYQYTKPNLKTKQTLMPT